MKYKIKRKNDTTIEIEAMNYYEENGFFTFFSEFNLPGINHGKTNIASIPIDDVELIILDTESTTKD